MKKFGGPQYGEFTFPSDCGFSGSAGSQSVKGYMRGGKVSSTHEPTTRNKDHTKGKGMSKKGMPGANAKRRSHGVKAKGGRVMKKQMGGPVQNVRVGGMGDAPGQQKMGFQGAGSDREVEVGDVKVTLPRKKGGRAKMSMHDKLMKEGGKMGYARGGQVKDTSGEFVAKRGKQDTMDSGTQPANKGSTQQEREAGGRGRLKPGFKEGGQAKKKGARKNAASMAKIRRSLRGLRGQMSNREAALMQEYESRNNPAAMRRLLNQIRSRVGEGTVNRAKGGRVAARHSGMGAVDNRSGKTNRKRAMAKPVTAAAKGGSIHKSGRKGMPATVKAKGGLAKAAGDRHSFPSDRGRKPYTGYNQQPGGSVVGDKDARYLSGSMGKRGAARSR